MMIFYLARFAFSISYSVLSFHLVYVFQFLHLFFLSQAFIKQSFCILINSMYNIYQKTYKF